jgi:hypothetical protein
MSIQHAATRCEVQDSSQDVEGDERLGRLRQTAVFATVVSTLPNESLGGRVHQEFGCLAMTERALACKMLITSMAST